MNKWVDLFLEAKNTGKIRETIHSVFHFLFGYSLVLILARAIPYHHIKHMYFPFISLENILWAVMIFFIIDKTIEPLDKIQRFFTVPMGHNPTSYQKKDLPISIMVFLSSLVYLLVIHDKNMPDPDEGWILTMSDRILHHDVPYKDFFLLVSPGAIYLNAWIFRIFGTKIIVERMATLILASFGSMGVYLLARLGMGFFFSVSASLLFLTWQFPKFFQASYSWYAVVSSIYSILIMGLTIMGQKRSYRKLLLVGVLCGISFLFKQNIGALTLVAAVSFFPIEHVLKDKHTRRGLLFPLFPSSFGIAEVIVLTRQCATILLGFAIPLGICAYAFFSKGCLADFVQGCFVNPLVKSKEFFHPYEPLTRLTEKQLIMYMSHFMMLTTFCLLLRKFRRASFENTDRFALLLLLATLFSFLSVFPRADFIHILFSLWPSLILLAYWTQQSVAFTSNWLVPMRPFPFLPSFDFRVRNLALVVLSCLPLMVFTIHITEKNLSLERDLSEIKSKRGKGIYGNHWAVDELNRMISFVKDYPDCGDQEVIFATNPLMYFLMNRTNPTPHDYILIGNCPDGWDTDIINTLESQRPCVIVLDKGFAKYYPVPQEWDRFERYIFSEYEVRYDSFGYTVLTHAEASDDTVQRSAEDDSSVKEALEEKLELSKRTEKL